MLSFILTSAYIYKIPYTNNKSMVYYYSCIHARFVLTNVLSYYTNVHYLLYLQDITEKAMKKEELRKKLPKSSHAPQEEESTHKKELEKAYKRIGDLETRVNDLTAQVTMVYYYHAPQLTTIIL